MRTEEGRNESGRDKMEIKMEKGDFYTANFSTDFGYRSETGKHALQTTLTVCNITTFY